MGTLLINLTWTVYNLMVISASAAVANETAQHRVVARVQAALPAHLSLSNGRTIVCQTSDFSASGLGLVLSQDATLEIGERVNVSMTRGGLECAFPGTIVVARGKTLGVQFAALTRAQQMMLVQMTFGRADMWSASWGASKPDAPYDAVKVVMGIGIRNLLRLAIVLIDLSVAPLRAAKPVIQAFAKK